MKVEWNSRYELGTILNSRGLLGWAVEVGVHVGWNFYQLRSKWKGQLLIGVDPWRVYEGADSTQETHDEYYRNALAATAGFGDTAKLIRATSLEVAARYADAKGVFDCVYLDGPHHYQAVKDDIAAWWPLIRPGGILAGHDFIANGWHRDNDPYNAYGTRAEVPDGALGAAEFGVIQAVTEVFSPEQIALTPADQDNGYRSWAVVKE